MKMKYIIVLCSVVGFGALGFADCVKPPDCKPEAPPEGLDPPKIELPPLDPAPVFVNKPPPAGF